MKFSVINGGCGSNEKLPVIYWLSGLTCTDRNFIEKAGAFRAAVENRVLIVCPDTSPRGVDIQGDSDSWDFGKGAGFYLNATQEKWAANYKMYDYVTKELVELVEQTFQTNGKKAIMGHSMGGHGALTIALKNPGMYTSVSAFAPICNPMQCPWGKKAFAGYLGDNQEQWKAYDATELMKGLKAAPFDDILIDVGDKDNFLTAGQLLPENFKAACDLVGQNCSLRMQPGYDHSYFFIATFVEDHVKFHKQRLSN
uniref:S-formylglutathione hydrolase n=1 Tax=Hanusia phi TaxID=3032 RepID=A0A7S0I1F0_9CRYP